MNIELSKQLCDKYNIIFPENFYFECDDGWYNIIDNLCNLITKHDEWKNRLVTLEKEGGLVGEDYDHVNVEAIQVKEKFGGLRFYVIGGDEYIRGIIEMAEKMSQTTCEVCGNVGKLRDTSWIKCLCDKHYEETTKKKLSEGSQLTIDMFDVTVAP